MYLYLDTCINICIYICICICIYIVEPGAATMAAMFKRVYMYTYT